MPINYTNYTNGQQRDAEFTDAGSASKKGKRKKEKGKWKKERGKRKKKRGKRKEHPASS